MRSEWQHASKTFVLLVFLVFPASNNYAMRDYSWGGGGTQGSDSTSYSMHANLGEVSEAQLAGNTYNALPGLEFTLMAHVPVLTVPEADITYNAADFVITDAQNPSDAEFAISVSTDNFESDIRYVQSDNTLGALLGAEDWRDYTGWGSSSGITVVGLEPNTAYRYRIKARQGEYSESAWSKPPVFTTDSVALSFDIDVANTDTESSAPYELSFGTLTPGSVTSTSDRVWIDLETNAATGGSVFLYGSNSGLYSTTADYTIAAVTGNLTALSEGFGLQYASVTESAGGPMAVDAPFDGTSENVGTLTTTPQRIFNSSANPVTAGRASFITKAKASSLAPAAEDYADTITIVAAANF